MTAEADDIHLAPDGAVLVIRDTGEQLWTNRDGLRGGLAWMQAGGKPIPYLRENPESDPPDDVFETFRLMVEASEAAGLPIQLVAEPHPEARVPPGERRTITRER